MNVQGVARRPMSVVATIVVAMLVGACTESFVMASPLNGAMERAGLQLRAASIVDVPAVPREAAELTANETIVVSAAGARLTRMTLVTVGGPGNARLDWKPAEHPLVYAAEWTDGSTLGLTLVSAGTGEVLLVTAY